MDETQEIEDAFAISGFRQNLSLAEFSNEEISTETDLWSLKEYINDVADDILTVGDGISIDFQVLDCRLPVLESFEYGPLENLGALESSSATATDESVDEGESPKEHLWSTAKLLTQSEPLSQFKSWEVFHDRGFKEPQTTYLSEGGPLAFCAAISARTYIADDLSHPGHGKILHSNYLLKGLACLGLGRESMLFHYTKAEQTFKPRIEYGYMSGFTVESFTSLTTNFINHGNKMRSIDLFIEYTYSSNNSSQATVSLANAFSDVMATLRSEFGSLSKATCGVIQLQSLFYVPGLIISLMDEIIKTLDGAKSDQELLSKLYSFAENREHETDGIRQVAFEIFARVSRPWLEILGSWLGISKQVPSGNLHQRKGFADVEKNGLKLDGESQAQDLYREQDTISMPAFVADEDAESILDTGRNLQLLRVYKSEHPLARPGSSGMPDVCTLEWQFSWQDVQRVVFQAQEYERNIAEAIKEFNASSAPTPLRRSRQDKCTQTPGADVFDSLEENVEAQLTASITAIERPFFEAPSGIVQRLSDAVRECSALGCGSNNIQKTSLVPPLSLVPALSLHPLIFAQARLVNQECLRLLFKEHKLRLHLSVQHRYSLFGDGVFATRLSHRLFNPDLQSAERRKGHSRSGNSGLKLGSRESWPPATSELRLVLMGILTDSFFCGQQDRVSSSFNMELPGDLSFAIREMTDDELKRCVDPDSIEALDFLRLQYKPPAPLDTVITPSSLVKYDQLFKLLLRATRMLYIANRFSQNDSNRSFKGQRGDVISQRFRIEAHQFVSAICSYFFDGVSINWRIFSQRLDDIEEMLEKHNDRDGQGLRRLRDFHEKVLDRMMLALLSRKRQEPMMKLLGEIFSLILVFDRLLRTEVSSHTNKTQDSATMKEIYGRFAKKTRVFVGVCKEMNERSGPRKTSRNQVDDGYDEFRKQDTMEDGDNTTGQLLLKLEMNGYYSKHGSRGFPLEHRK